MANFRKNITRYLKAKKINPIIGKELIDYCDVAWTDFMILDKRAEKESWTYTRYEKEMYKYVKRIVGK